MKKCLTLFLSLLLSVSAALTASAANVAGRTADITIEKISTPPVIDGSFSVEEWGEPISSITKENRAEYLRLCAKDHPELLESDKLLPTKMNTYLRWDEDGIYFCCAMESVSHYNDTTEQNVGAIWKGTSFIWEIISDISVTDSVTRIDICLNNDGKILSQVVNAEKNTAVVTGTSTPAYKDVAIVRDGTTTIYEASFLWDVILPEGMEKSIGDSFLFFTLYMPGMENLVNPVDVLPSGFTEMGITKYWNVILTESLTPTPESGYTRDDTFLYNIHPQTTLGTFTAQFAPTSGTITVTAPDGTVLTAPDAYIGTGYTVSLLADGTAADSLTAVVTGDVTGDGQSEDADVTVLQRYFAGWNTYADAIDFPAAADLNRDGKLTRADGMLLARRNAGWDV
ncbi:MAG: hypothetical protein II979_02730 [Clostridia bacterium]|nr:hypothetical protein [Clostridia bacterium]